MPAHRWLHCENRIAPSRVDCPLACRRSVPYSELRRDAAYGKHWNSSPSRRPLQLCAPLENLNGRVLLLAFAFSYAAILRPDGALAGRRFVPALCCLRSETSGPSPDASRHGAVCEHFPYCHSSLWASAIGRPSMIQPLASRYAGSDEYYQPRFQPLTKTVCADFTCTWEIYTRTATRCHSTICRRAHLIRLYSTQRRSSCLPTITKR